VKYVFKNMIVQFHKMGSIKGFGTLKPPINKYWLYYSSTRKIHYYVGWSTVCCTKVDLFLHCFFKKWNLIKCYMINGLNILWFGLNNVWYFIYVVKCTNFFLQLELATWCFWTFKATNVSCNKLCGLFFH
jgi:hypothetical protein